METYPFRPRLDRCRATRRKRHEARAKRPRFPTPPSRITGPKWRAARTDAQVATSSENVQQGLRMGELSHTRARARLRQRPRIPDNEEWGARVGASKDRAMKRAVVWGLSALLWCTTAAGDASDQGW